MQTGIFNYLVSKDDSVHSTRMEILFANDIWRTVKNVESRRQKNIAELLLLISNLDTSHEELHVRITRYLDGMEKGFLGRSQLRGFIQRELSKINPLSLDRENLAFLQSIVDKDPEGRVAALVMRISQLEEELLIADEVHKSDQYQIKYLQAQISGLQIAMQEHQRELESTLEVIKKNKVQERDREMRIAALEKTNLKSETTIHDLLLVLKAKGIIENDEMRSENLQASENQSSEKFNASSSLEPLTPESIYADEAHSLDSRSSSVMTASLPLKSLPASKTPEKPALPFRI